MAFRKYTQCYVHTPGDKPFNESNLIGTVFAGGAAGLIVVLIGVLMSSYVTAGIGAFIAVITGINTVADEWLYHRLICLTGTQCAMGKVMENPTDGGLGNFDNDQYFDVLLMPNYELQKQNMSEDLKENLEKYPANKIHADGFMGEKLLKPQLMDLSYAFDKNQAWSLHCEAEGDFWIKMKEWAALIAAIVAGIAVGTTAAGAAGAAGGAALGCAIGGIFGPIGCLIGAIIGAIAGALAAGGLATLAGVGLLYLILSALFETNKGNVEDANVGDKALGPIRAGDKVIVYGEHVYDGFHEGWHEFHPLMAVMKLDERQVKQYLEWQPDYKGDASEYEGVTPDDVRQGMNSLAFAAQVKKLKDTWCGMIGEAFSPSVRTHQATEGQQWTIHPFVDGCEEAVEPPR